MPMRIFIVEDHQVVREALTSFLERFGHTVFSAGGLVEALQSLPSALCHVLICDVKLPDGDAWELLKQAGPGTPRFAIAMSGFYSDAHREASKAAGYRYHLRKPIHPEELLVVLEEAAREITEREFSATPEQRTHTCNADR